MCAVRRQEADVALGSTSVDNLFMMEYLASAPGEFVKVYLYGLWLAQYGAGDGTLEEIALGAGVDQDVALSAFLYWERMKLVEIAERDPLEVRYGSALHRMMENTHDQETVYRYAAFHQKLQGLFGSSRLLTANELDQMDRWAEEEGFSQDAVCRVCEYARIRYGAKVTSAELREAFALFRDRDAGTPEAARQLMLSEKSLYDTAKKILRSYSLRREPTAEELRILREAADAGLETGAILEAARQAGTARSPGFSYLKPVLQNLIREGAFTAKAAQHFYEGEKKDQEGASRLLRALGFTGAAPAALASSYREWMDYGFSEDALETLCRSLSARGQGTPEALERALENLKKSGVSTDDALADTMRETEDAYEAASAWLAVWGEHRSAGGREAAYARRFARDGWKPDMLLAAAEASAGAERPFAYMKRVLDAWKEAGVKTPEEAARLRPAQESGKKDDGSVHFELENKSGKNGDYFDDLFAEERG